MAQSARKKRISFIATVYQEAQVLERFLDSILAQSVKPDEVVIVDAGSTDGTWEALQQYSSAFKKVGIHYVIVQESGNRAVGRNKAITLASHDLIAASDAGCILHKDWLRELLKADEKLLSSAQGTTVEKRVIAGYYSPAYGKQSAFQKAVAAYMCVMPDRLQPDTFLPSSRSVMFTKAAWAAVGGYPEDLTTCEDLVFARRLWEAGALHAMAEKAVVFWPQHTSLWKVARQFYMYAFGDGQALYIRKSTPLLFGRYAVGMVALIVALVTQSPPLSIGIGASLLGYCAWAVWKNYRYVRSLTAFLYLPLLQFTADFTVMAGMIHGFLEGKKEHAVVLTAYQTVGKIITSALGMVMLLLMTRHLGAAGFGEYNFVLAFVGVAYIAADMGLSPVLMRASAEGSLTKKDFNSLVMLRVSICALIMMVSAAVGTWYFNYDAGVVSGIIVAGLAQTLLIVASTGWDVMKGRLSYGRIVLIQILTSSAHALLVWIAILAHAEVQTFYWVFALGYAISAVATFYMSPFSLEIHLDMQRVVAYVRRALPFMLGVAVGIASARVNILMIGNVYDPSIYPYVGYYAMGLRVFDVIMILGGYYGNTLFPILSGIRTNAARWEYFKRHIWIGGIIAIGVFVGMYAGAGFMVDVLGGEAFQPSIQIIRILGIAGGITIIEGFLYSYLLAIGKEKFWAALSTAMLVMTIVSNYLFIPMHTYIATSWVLVATHATACMISCVAVWWYAGRKLKPMGSPTTQS